MFIDKDMTIGEVLKVLPASADIFNEMGMECLDCPHAVNETIAEACTAHGVFVASLLQKLNSLF